MLLNQINMKDIEYKSCEYVKRVEIATFWTAVKHLLFLSSLPEIWRFGEWKGICLSNARYYTLGVMEGWNDNSEIGEKRERNKERYVVFMKFI